LNFRDEWFFLRKNHVKFASFGVHLRENCFSHKNKDVATMGHPETLLIDAGTML